MAELGRWRPVITGSAEISASHSELAYKAPETMTDSESDGAGYLSEDNQETGFLDGPRDSAALAASSYTRMPHGMTMTPKIPPGFDGIMSWFEYEQLVDDWV